MKFQPLFEKIKFLVIFAISFALRFPLFFILTMIFYTFQDRDISRAQALLEGKMILFGPELTGGGNLPGPFYYFLLSPPLMLKLGWMGAWYWMFVLLSLGGTIGWYFFRSRFDSATAFLWLLVYSFIYPITYLISTFFNPSFSILFLVLANIFTIKSFTDSRDDEKDKSLLISFFLCSLIIQIHYSGITHLIALLILLIFSKKLGFYQHHLKKIFQGFGLFLLGLSPYIIFQIFSSLGINLGQTRSYVGSTTGALPSLFNYFKISGSVLQFIFLCIQKLFLVTPVALILVVLIKIIFSRKKIYENFDRAVQFTQEPLNKVLSIIAILNFFPFSFYFFVPQGSRYGAPFAITMSFLSIIWLRKWVNSPSAWKRFNVFAGLSILSMAVYISDWKYLKADNVIHYMTWIAVCILTIALFLYGKKYRREALRFSVPILSFILIASAIVLQSLAQTRAAKNIHAEGNMPVYWQWNAIWTKIYNATGWNLDEAFERTFFVNHQRESSPRRAYEHFTNGVVPKKTNKPDGFFVSIDKPPGEDGRDWLLKQQLQVEILEGLKSGAITIGKYESNARVFVAPYFIHDKKNLPSYFHSAGWGYNSLPEQDLLNQIGSVTGAKKVSDSKYIFKWNDCPDHHQFCDIGFILDFEKGEKVNLKVKVVGLSLAQSSKWISPTWTQALINPFVEIKCGDKTQKFLIASNIGYNRQYVGLDRYFKFPMVNNSILAPLSRNFETDCKGGIDEITAGYVSSEVEQEYDSAKIQGSQQTIKVN